MNQTIAQNVVAYREENGVFASSPQLKKVPRLGPKAYEQAVGFLRIIGGKTIFDNTDIHPESYAVAKTVLERLGLDQKDVGTEKVTEAVAGTSVAQLATGLSVGEATLQDILDGLTKPGRDLRDNMPAPLLRTDVLKMSDLRPGMKLEGDCPQRCRLRCVCGHWC